MEKNLIYETKTIVCETRRFIAELFPHFYKVWMCNVKTNEIAGMCYRKMVDFEGFKTETLNVLYRSSG